MKRVVLITLMLVALAGCTKKGFLAAPDADPEVHDKVGSFATDTHFLLEPTADAEALLGRAVHVTSKGGWTIADERAPGCQVRVQRSTADYEKSYRIGLGDMTAMSGGYRELLKLEARYGRSVEAAMKVHNVETLTADTEGPCGEVIVKSVRIGTGERTLLRKAEGAASGRVGKGPVGLEGGREAATDVADEMRWSSPQAYAFTYEQIAERKIFELSADIPEKVVEGDHIAFSLSATDDAFVVVYYLDERGQGGLLFPNGELPVPTIKAGATLVLPPPGTRQISATLLEPGKPARDTLVIYAFAKRGDFDHFKPGVLADGETMTGYTAKLTEALSNIPISRWDRHTATIEILPRSP